MPLGNFPKPPLRDLFSAASPECISLLTKCLLYEPRKRISARDVSAPMLSAPAAHLSLGTQALRHPYFTTGAYPTHPSKLPKPASKPGSNLTLEEFDGNVEPNGNGPGVKANAPNKLKRKLSEDDLNGGSRSIARKLDFTQNR